MKKNCVFLSRFLIVFITFYAHSVNALIPTIHTEFEERITFFTQCPKDSYVSKCGDYYVGTNWLKGYSKTESVGTNTFETHSPDYFDYSDNADEINMNNLRTFFTAADGTNISFTPNTGAIEQNTVEQSDFIKHRDTILTQFCNPNKVSIKCESCPGKGKTKGESKYTSSGNWTSFNTIAHCYMDEYTDTTGTYEYIDANNTTTECHFVIGVNYMGGSILGKINSNGTTVTTTDSMEDSATSLPAPPRR